MASLNQITIIGNLGQDPELRFLPNGNAVANLSVATNETWKDKEGNKQEKATFHRVVLYGKTAEVAGEYLKKGGQVFIQGRIENREYEKDGEKRYVTEIVASDMKMLGAAKAQENSQTSNQKVLASMKGKQAAKEMESDDIPY